ncbi:MAG: alpha/beta hydrolase fold domain-containing protein [Pseudonocardiaceae bacterium]|nr:alpha/beta hydrolase fold domain-containing protein [Pseudonocardiaceae bacterium]
MDPELAVVFPHLPVLDLGDVPRAREVLSQMLAEANADVEPAPNVRRRDHVVPGAAGAPDVKVRSYRPADQTEPLPCLYWIHGGGHVLGSVDQDDPLAEHYVNSVGCVVVSVDWRRAPEHPYPAPMDDCYAGLKWACENATELQINPQRIAVGGASSGGGSAAGLILLARDRGEIPVCYQLLIYPMIDDRNVTPSSQSITEPRVWNRESNIIGWRCYLGHEAGTTEDVPVYAAPSREQDLHGLPPAFIAVGDLDLFLDEDIEYAQRLLQAGVPTELHVYAGAFHGFDLLGPGTEISHRLMSDRDRALRRAFERIH